MSDDYEEMEAESRGAHWFRGTLDALKETCQVSCLVCFVWLTLAVLWEGGPCTMARRSGTAYCISALPACPDHTAVLEETLDIGDPDVGVETAITVRHAGASIFLHTLEAPLLLCIRAGSGLPETLLS